MNLQDENLFFLFLKQTGILTSSDLKEFTTKKITKNEDVKNHLAKFKFNATETNFIWDTYLKCDYCDINKISVDENLLMNIPEEVFRENKCLPIEDAGIHIKIAMANPLSFDQTASISNFFTKNIHAILVDEGDLNTLMNRLFSKKNEIREKIFKLAGNINESIRKKEIKLASNLSHDSGVNVLNDIFTEAVRQGVSDIHIEYHGNRLRIRMRVDGMLDEQVLESRKVSEILFRRIRVLANIDITNTQVPQDGSFNIVLDGKLYSMRASILPTLDGSSAVIRISSPDTSGFDLAKAITNKTIYDNVIKFLNRNEGLMLVTGPTGSGKTTLLYSAIAKVNTPKVKIISVEDPVEVPINRVCQVQVNNEIGMTFPAVLRSCLRQDPDIILVGEIRDEETANIALRASMTGHKVFATLHSKSVINTIERLLDLNIDSHVLAESINIVISQRLVKKICSECAKPYQLPNEIAERVKKITGSETLDDTYMQGEGCQSCRYLGSKGRQAVCESIYFTRQLKRLIGLREFDNFKTEAGKLLSGQTLLDQALNYAKEGSIHINDALAMLD